MFLIERVAKTPATLQRKTAAIVDGQQEWGPGESVKVFGMKNTRLGTDGAGQQIFGDVFYIPPLATDPALPLRLTVKGRVYDVTFVKYYQDHRGKRLDYRLTVAGA